MEKPQNFIFDMGRVLMDFDPMFFAQAFCDNKEDARRLADAYFNNPLWQLLDAGVITEQTMKLSALNKLDERLHAPLCAMTDNWEQTQPVLTEMNDCVDALHAQGFGCYLLSNAGVRWWKMKDRIPCMQSMDGFVVSAFEHLMKPDVLIYETLCSRYNLDPKTCLFIDDNEENCFGAQRTGMQSYHYTGDAKAFKNYLKQAFDICL